MIWKLQPSPIFWIPIPAIGQSIGELTAWQNPLSDVQPKTMDLTNPETNEPYQVEILDLLGPYPMDNLPTHIARQIGGKKLTGKLLAAMLQKKKPEFRDVTKIFFYQVNPINQPNLTNGKETTETAN